MLWDDLGVRLQLCMNKIFELQDLSTDFLGSQWCVIIVAHLGFVDVRPYEPHDGGPFCMSSRATEQVTSLNYYYTPNL